MEQFLTPEFWVAVGQIIMIDILLGGDNAVVIALACRKLPPAQRTKGIIWGTAGAAQGAGEGHQMPLVVFGRLVSIPIIVWGSQLVIKLMDRFPIIITLGGMLLGWIAGTMAVSDPAVVNPAAWAWVPKGGPPLGSGGLCPAHDASHQQMGEPQRARELAQQVAGKDAGAAAAAA